MTVWNDYQWLVMIIAPLLTLALMYALRRPAHGLLQRFAKALHRLLRLAARGCLRAEQRIRLRNHEVTKALAEALMERQLERRFMRIERLVERDLDNYQKLAAQINKQLTVIGEDYEASSEVPNPSPEWIAAVEAIATLEGDQRNSEVMARILADMHNTVQEHHREALREHRWTVSARHKVLSGLKPKWRRLTKLLEHIDHNIEILRQRLRQVDRHMGQFELLTAGSGQGIMSSMLMRFVIALCFVGLGALAAWLNYHLLLEPLDNVLAGQQVADFSLSSLMAILHIGITLTAAALMTESLKITHLLPLTGAMTRRGRATMLWVGVLLLSFTIAVEFSALLGASGAATTLELGGLPAISLSLVSVMMPLIIAVAVMPLEYLLHTVRPVVGSAVQVVMHALALTLRLLASLAVDLGKAAVLVYDAIIFLPLALERAIQRKLASKAAAQQVAENQPVVHTVAAQNVTELRVGSLSSLPTRQD